MQVKGQKKSQKEKPKTDKQEVEIRQRMTAAALAEAMNRDFGEKQNSETRCFYPQLFGLRDRFFFFCLLQIMWWKLC